LKQQACLQGGRATRAWDSSRSHGELDSANATACTPPEEGRTALDSRRTRVALDSTNAAGIPPKEGHGAQDCSRSYGESDSTLMEHAHLQKRATQH
jgi:hypothetical protein